jgi:hypothetical protein
VAADGTIRTGARRDRVPAAFEPVLADAAVLQEGRGGSLYLYGSVANGTARPGSSDVDLLSVGLPEPAVLARRLSARYSGLCRGVEVAAFAAADLAGESDEAYGNRVFLRHYCVHLTGPDPAALLPAFPADARAARGFNGDFGRHLRRWRLLLDTGTAPAGRLGVRVARKTLLAVAGLASVHDRTWTTDRQRAARRWSEVNSGLSPSLTRLLSWASAAQRPAPAELANALADDGIAGTIAQQFDHLIGLWPDNPAD